MRPTASPPLVKPTGRRALMPKLATVFGKLGAARTLPPPVTFATASGSSAWRDGPFETGSMAARAAPGERPMTIARIALHEAIRERLMRWSREIMRPSPFVPRDGRDGRYGGGP